MVSPDDPQPDLLRIIKGESSPGERQAFEGWLCAAPENRALYDDTRRVLGLIDRSVTETPVESPAWTDLKSRRPFGSSTTGPPGTGRGALGWLSRAALAAGLTVLGFGIAQLADRGDSRMLFGPKEFVTGRSETATVTLRDGSVVRLAPSSRLRALPDRNRRRVWLEGRAFFAVARDSTRPFIVETSAGRAAVLGTRFELRVEERGVRLVVVQGRVALSTSSKTVEVRAGEMSRADRGGPPSVVKVEDVQSLLDWPGGVLVFLDTPLVDAASEIGDHYGRTLVVDSALAARPITAWFSGETFEEALTAVCRAARARCVWGQQKVTLEP